MRRDETTGRIIALFTFLAGVALLVFVAVTAYSFFTQSTAVLPPANDTTTPAATRLGESAIRIFVQIALLFILTIVGSVLASKGIHLYSIATGNNMISSRNKPDKDTP